ncbi:hypothetical protein R1flu_014290 [Riccia fluitans]|uniref:Uncharacterized protein n=1 Tax=Riccia fluitans TaxID=41844 RepID=A0ABD1YJ28_9MARC
MQTSDLRNDTEEKTLLNHGTEGRSSELTQGHEDLRWIFKEKLWTLGGSWILAVLHRDSLSRCKLVESNVLRVIERSLGLESAAIGPEVFFFPLSLTSEVSGEKEAVLSLELYHALQEKCSHPSFNLGHHML